MVTAQQSVRTEQRFIGGRRCPICGGADREVRGKGRRCHGFVSGDGAYANCSREEHAGGLIASEGDTYGHRLTGPCKCGTTHGTNERDWLDIEVVYDYRDSRGTLLSQVVRKSGKQFSQRRPDGSGGWEWKTAGMARVLYRLPELMSAPLDAMVYIVEGEKDVDNLRKLGAVATCNPMGAGKWSNVEDSARQALAGRHVVIIADADEPGRDHAAKVRASLVKIAATVRVLELPKKDASDWIEAGGTLAELQQIAASVEAEESTSAPKPKAIGRTWSDCVEEIYARMNEPLVDISIGATVIATCRNGSFIALVAPSGAGKSSLALQMLIEHAIARGPSIYVTHELDGDEAVARGIGQLCERSWMGTLRGEVERVLIPEIKRFRVLERDDATMEKLEVVVEEVRAAYPSEPISVVVDYLQATPAPAGKERGHVAGISTELRRAAKRLRVVIMGVSQASTGNAAAMRRGDLIGIEASSTGAETSQIERDAYLILTLGDRREVDPDTIAWMLSTAKQRMGTADTVRELHFRGRVGVFEVVGDARSATQVRDGRKSDRSEKERETIKRSIVQLVSSSPVPMSKKEITDRTTGGNVAIASAIKELVRDSVLAHDHEASKSGHAPLWTPERIAARVASEPVES